MPPLMECPEETDLLAFAAGEDLSSHLAAHVAACPHCRPTIIRLQAEIGRLRSTQSLNRATPTIPKS
jgi:anti-sigma factor ChrR (cupin superfamily)